jgi:hypothetical protein
MRCMACGAAMHLMQVQPAESSMGPGFEHHTFECSECKDTERRLVFSPPSAPRPESVAATSASHGGQRESDHALLRNAWDMLRGGWRKGL